MEPCSLDQFNDYPIVGHGCSVSIGMQRVDIFYFRAGSSLGPVIPMTIA
jgi:hypothetical protein